MKTACLALLALALTGAPPARAGADGGLAVTEIAPGIYVHGGVHVPFGAPGADDIANTGFIVGQRCVAVVDTGGSTRAGERLHEALRAVTPLPVCYVINTHAHFDHVLGDFAFAAEGPEYVGHADLAAAIDASRALFAGEYGDYLGSDSPADRIIAPNTGVSDSMELDLGGRILRLNAWPAAHSHADLTVFDVQTATLWSGDLVFMDRIPALDGSLLGWLSVMDALKAIPAARVVPGHGPVSAPWPDALAPQQAYLTRLRDQTRASIAAGAFIEEAVENQGQDDRGNWLLFDQHHRRNVSRAFTELEWE